MNKIDSLDILNNEWASCTRCALCNERKNVVFGYGNPNAPVLIIGEAPGANEDEQGEPFVGKSGMLLDNLLAAVSTYPELIEMCNTDKFNFDRIREVLLNDFFYTNVVACHPPDNRDPTAKEIEACWTRLKEIIYTVDPVLIIAAGRVAIQALFKKEKINIQSSRGSIFELELEGKAVTIKYPVLAILHPAFLLRNPDFNSDDGWAKKTYKDILRAMHIVDEYNWRHYGTPKSTLRPKLDKD